MLDTICLTLTQRNFQIINHNLFTPSTAPLFSLSSSTLSENYTRPCRQFPTKRELKNGIYKPNLSVYKGQTKNGEQILMRIEFSVPELIFGNNFDEVTNNDFQKVIEKLKKKLQEMGVLVKVNDLKKASVSKIHYSKNIILTDGSIPSLIIYEIHRIDLTKKLDLSQTDYKNGGHSLKYHSNSFELIFYDKLKDLAKTKLSPKRAVESESSLIQVHLLDELKPFKPFEVFRSEARLNKRVKIRQIFNKLGIDKELTFENLYSEEISKRVLNYYWFLITKEYRLLEYKPTCYRDLLYNLANANQKYNLSTILKIIGTKAVLSEIGESELRVLIYRFGPSAWTRLKSKLQETKFPESVVEPLEVVTRGLVEFAPVNLVDFTQLSLQH